MINLSNENIVHVKGKNIEYLQFRKLLEYKEIKHCYTLSVNNFNALGSAIEDYKKLSKELEIDFNSIVRPNQTHTNVVQKVDEKPIKIDIFEKYKNVDGLITDKSNITLALSFADCTPIFLYDTQNNVIGNIHSGWRGTLQRIATVAVEKMKKEYDSKPENIVACIGPCIKKCHFEVKQDVYELFYNEFKNIGKIDEIIEKSNENYKIDTTLINKILLQEAGLKQENIIDSGICTVCNSDLMHSYRVKGKDAGRNTAIICKR